MRNYAPFNQATANPFQEIVTLNSNALQNFSNLLPHELAQFGNPIELWEKQLEFYVKNSYYMMDYMHQLSNLFNQSCSLYEEKITAPMTTKKKGKRTNPLNIKTSRVSAATRKHH